MPPTTASSVASGTGSPPGAWRRPVAQVGDEALDRGLVAVVDPAAGAQALDQDDAGQRRLGGERRQQGGDRRRGPAAPRGLAVRRAGAEHLAADPLDRRLVGGEEALVLTLEVLVEVTLGDRRALADQ